MKYLLLAAAAAFAVIAPTLAADPPAEAPAPPPSPGEIVAAAPAADWVAIAPSDLLVMDLAPDAKGKPRRVVIQLMPPPFSQGWIGNIRNLATAHWYDGISVVRVQDNYVVQWGDPEGEDAAKAKPLPDGLSAVPESQYEARIYPGGRRPNYCLESDIDNPCPEFTDTPKTIVSDNRDAYAEKVGFYAGWPIAIMELSGPIVPVVSKKRSRQKVQVIETLGWPIHCYGMVGVGRNMSPDTGSGAELYVVIGHAPRHLDRNIALVGRVISGIEYLSSLPRGTGPLGFYEDEAERVGISSIRLASDLPAAEQPRFEYLSTVSDVFTKYADARANRRDPFFIHPAGGADICNIPVPIRPIAAK